MGGAVWVGLWHAVAALTGNSDIRGGKPAREYGVPGPVAAQRSCCKMPIIRHRLPADPKEITERLIPGRGARWLASNSGRRISAMWSSH